MHPYLRNNKSFLYYSIAWIMISMIQVIVLSYFYQLHINTALISSLIFSSVYFLIGLGLWYPIRFIYQSGSQSLSGILNFIGLGVGTVLLWNTIVSNLIRLILSSDLQFLEMIRDALVLRLILATLVFLILMLVYYLLLYFSAIEQRKVNEANLESMIRESELNLLKFKLNPHFLFNSLNSISSLTMSKPEKAQEMIIKLSDYLRYSLESDKQPVRALKHEVSNIHLYIDIEKIRFGTRLEYLEDLAEACLDIQVPAMLLQPLFENAIKHGVGESTETVKIEFNCMKTNHYLELVIRNDFVSGTEVKPGTGTGLTNVSNRLITMYGQKDLMAVSQKDQKFEVFIKIPLES